jgi:CRP/FNR family transcriptional regulator, cyclic AMP receptor protein
MTDPHGLAPLLAEHPFFKGLKPEHLATVAGCASNVRFDAGAMIAREGDEATQFFVIRHGIVAIESYVPQAGAVVIQTVSAGDILGWSWLLPPYHWQFSARAQELVRAIALDGTCLRGKCEADHGLGYELLKRFAEIVAQRLSATRVQLLDLYGHTTAGR